jgi:hypothetical protein
MIRVRDDDREVLADAPLAGVVERLGTGEKRPFASADELLQLVATWTHSSADPQDTTLPTKE